MNDAHLQEEADFANAEYAPMLGNTRINPAMFERYEHPHDDWDWRQRASMILGDLHHKRLLDFGCGQGEESAYFAKLGAKVTGIDISEVGVQVARERAAANGLDIDFHVMNCLNTDFPDESFDIVHGLGILHHVGLEEGLREIHRLLVPGGLAVFLEPLQSTRTVEGAKEWLSSKLSNKLDLIPVTSGEENLKQADIENAAARWSSHSIYLYNITYRVRKLFMPRAGWNHLLRMDAYLLEKMHFLRKYAGAALIALRK